MSRRTVLSLFFVLTAWGCGPSELANGGAADGSTETATVTETEAADGPTEDAVCGNGLIEAGEECDDGNELGCDACVECESFPAMWSIRVDHTVGEAVADAEHVYLLGSVDEASRITALSPHGELLWEGPFDADLVHSREMVALGDRVAVLLRDGPTQIHVLGQEGLVWSELAPASWSAARFGQDLAVVEAISASPNVDVYDADDGTFVDGFPIGSSYVASHADPVVITDWNDGLVIGYTDVHNHQVVTWIDAGGGEVGALAIEGHIAGVAAGPDGHAIVASRDYDSAFEFIDLTPSGIGEMTPSVAPVNFGVYLDALDVLSTGHYAALIETQPDFGFFSMHLEVDGRAILDSRHFGYTDEPVTHPCGRWGGTIAGDAAYLPADDPEGVARLTKFRLD